MREYINANETLRENDSETIRHAIRLALEDGCRKVIVPRYSVRTREMKWTLSKAVALPERFTLVLDNCVLERPAGAKDSLLTNEGVNADPAMRTAGDLVIYGEGNVSLCSEENDAEAAPLLCFQNVSGLRIENLFLERCRQGMTLSDVRNAFIRNIDLCGASEAGIDVRPGCGSMLIENVTGGAVRTETDPEKMKALRGADGWVTLPNDVRIRNVLY